MHNFTYLVVLFQKESPILIAAYSLVVLLLLVHHPLFFYKTILSRVPFKGSFVVKAVWLPIPSLNLKSKYWFLDQYRLPSKGISEPNLLQENTVFRRKVLFSYPF
jgi:hypothetical protein